MIRTTIIQYDYVTSRHVTWHVFCDDVDVDVDDDDDANTIYLTMTRGQRRKTKDEDAFCVMSMRII